MFFSTGGDEIMVLLKIFQINYKSHLCVLFVFQFFPAGVKHQTATALIVRSGYFPPDHRMAVMSQTLLGGTQTEV